MEHNTDRILWTVLVLAIGVALYVIFRPAANGLLGQGIEKIQDVVTNVNSDTVDSNSDFSYSDPNTADNTISIVGYSGHAENLTIPQHHKIGSVSYKVTAIDDRAFQGNTSIKQVIIPDGVTSIGVRAFEGTALTSVNIPDSVTSIGDNAFMNNYNLKSLTLGSGVTSIGDFAFNKTSISAISFKNRVDLAYGTFTKTNLKDVTLPTGSTYNGKPLDANGIRNVFDSDVTVTFK